MGQEGNCPTECARRPRRAARHAPKGVATGAGPHPVGMAGVVGGVGVSSRSLPFQNPKPTFPKSRKLKPSTIPFEAHDSIRNLSGDLTEVPAAAVELELAPSSATRPPERVFWAFF